MKALIISFLLIFSAAAIAAPADIEYEVSLQPDQQTFLVTMKTTAKGPTEYVMPVWTPGYYQKMNFADNLSNFKVTTAGKEVKWEKKGDNVWAVAANANDKLTISYAIKATRPFVAAAYLGKDRGYIIPGALFVYPEGGIKMASTVKINTINDWKIATGLENLAGQEHVFVAPDFDVLYDSPLLIAPLETLPSFEVRNVPHIFTGYKLGEFDKEGFMKDLKKIVASAVDIIGDIPFKKYTFIGIGPGQGGIEHLNSTTVSFNGAGLTAGSGRRALYNFLAHEYFHHYNVKRIRPIELGPFDYKNGSRTNMLWVSEGLSVYYNLMVVKRAGLMTDQELFDDFKANILAYETKPGRHYQSLVQASYQTWSDGPFGRTEDEVNRTISYYDKGPAVGMLMDFAIRNATNNKKSLDDVMRKMYYTYYKELKRGFTEKEFRDETEKIAGFKMDELFSYTTTTKELDYQKYLNYAGLKIDTVTKIGENRYTGIRTRMRGDSLLVTAVDYESPAWKAGIRNRDIILTVNGVKAGQQTLADMESTKPEGDVLNLGIQKGAAKSETTLKLGIRKDRSFNITKKPDATPLQKEILKSWLGE